MIKVPDSEAAGAGGPGCQHPERRTLVGTRAELDDTVLAETAPRDAWVHRPGQVIQARYKLLHCMGHGGMGEVWLAQHIALDSEVAIKLTSPEMIDLGVGDLLLHEARVLARLNHPSIVRVLDFGTAESGFPFMVLELLRGPSLRQVLARKGPLTPTAAARVLLPVASALSTTHAHGVVHRDLKPENVILVPESSGALTPKVFDFGICGAAPPLEGPPDDGTLSGSPEYMSPEQVRGDAPVDRRTDVWAFCVVFYELVSGCSLFARSTVLETLGAVAWEPLPPLTATQGDLALTALLARGLAKDQALRWSSMQVLGEQLAAWALRAGVEEDCAGTSLRTHWLQPVLHPLSDPPRASRTAGRSSSLVVSAVLEPLTPRPLSAVRARTG